jgi:hypothetical protein
MLVVFVAHALAQPFGQLSESTCRFTEESILVLELDDAFSETTDHALRLTFGELSATRTRVGRAHLGLARRSTGEGRGGTVALAPALTSVAPAAAGDHQAGLLPQVAARIAAQVGTAL